MPIISLSPSYLWLFEPCALKSAARRGEEPSTPLEHPRNARGVPEVWGPASAPRQPRTPLVCLLRGERRVSKRDGIRGATPFGGRLRRLREAAGLSQEELAARAGLTAKAISMLERGERKRPYPTP